MEPSALDRWTLPKFDLVPDAAIAEVRGHPRFGEALRHIFSNALAHGARDRPHARVFHDLERFVLGMLTLYLDVTGGITHSRVRELGSEGGMMSSGRASAVLLYMRSIGYVTPAAKGARGQVRRYEASPALYETFQDRMRFEFEAAAMIDPAVASVANHLADLATFRAVCAHLGEVLRYATRGSGRPEFQQVERVVSRRDGMLLLYSLLLSLDDGGAFPRGGELTVSIRTISGQLGVSRTHIRSILAELETAGQFVRGQGGTDILAPSFVETFARYYATLIIGVLHACVGVIREQNGVA